MAPVTVDVPVLDGVGLTRLRDVGHVLRDPVPVIRMDHREPVARPLLVGVPEHRHHLRTHVGHPARSPLAEVRDVRDGRRLLGQRAEPELALGARSPRPPSER